MNSILKAQLFFMYMDKLIQLLKSLVFDCRLSITIHLLDAYAMLTTLF